ncbi:MAG: right-handed parallel beta-helix repeat-containing protein [Candidatus Limivivens sp.]|nr:right-handed parallel beta-helix repeat-containing protein [Candidatus Limivivens sp.]
MKERRIVKPYPGMVIRESVVFAPGVYNFFGKEGLVISGEDIEIDGNGCVFIGGKPKKGKVDDSYSSEFSYGYGEMTDDGLGFFGIGIQMENCRKVRLHNVCVRGFEIGLYMEGCQECEIFENDFSYNYHNPGWGWEEHKDLGGMILKDCHQNEIWKNKATDVWSALVLRECSQNLVHDNNCSHTSNVGLRMWLSCHNRIENNDFSWGLRKEPDEVHARDSSCVLIEAGSCFNVLKKNDMRFGGDGLFIRSLNNMMSIHNLFEENDASFANNNAIEAWDAYNVYIRNKANYSSYGFWLGCSDHTVLIENEVIGNGQGFQNAPEAFGNAGIAVVNGSGNDFYLEGNRIQDNFGPGLAVRFKQEDPSRNWVLINNRICGNHNDPRGYLGHGVYLKHVFGMHFIGNEIRDNEGEAIFSDEDVSEVYVEEPETKWEKTEIFCETEILEEKTPCRFWIDKKYESCRFYTDQGYSVREKEPVFSFEHPGRVRMRVMAREGQKLATGERNFYVLPKGIRIPELHALPAWQSDEGEAQSGEKQTVRLTWQEEKNPRFACRIRPVSLKDQTHLTLFCHYQNDFIDMEQMVKGPVVTLVDSSGKTKRITPEKPLFAGICGKENEAKYEWLLCEIPLSETEGFRMETEEGFGEEIAGVGVSFEMPMESTGALTIREGILCRKQQVDYQEVWSLKEIPDAWKEEAAWCSSGKMDERIFGEVPYCYTGTRKWESARDSTREEWRLSFGMERPVNALEICFYTDGEDFVLPKKMEIRTEDGQLLREISDLKPEGVLAEGLDVQTKGIRISFEKEDTSRIGIWRCRVLRKATTAIQNASCGSVLHLDKAVVKLNVEKGGENADLSDLEYALYESNEADILASRLIFRGSLQSEEIHPGKELSLEFDGKELECGKTYHLMLWQQNMAAGIQKGAYYRWVGDGIAQMDGSYGYISDLKVMDRNRTGWGKNYLKLCYEEVVRDGTNQSEGMGNRFGLAGMDKLYQKFRVPTEKNFGEYE